MARLTKPLNDTQIRQAKAQDKSITLTDGKGLQLLIRTSGTKSWQFKYSKPITKKRTNMGLGTYPEVSLAEARKIVSNLRSLLAQNIDPQENRKNQLRTLQAAHSNTLKLVTDSWLEVKKSQVSSDHAKDIYRSFELHIFPKLGNKPITKINALETIEILQPIQELGHFDLVKRLCQRINEVMTYAVNAGLTEHNPLAGITKAFKAAPKNNYPTIQPSDLPEFMQKLRDANITQLTRLLIKWQLHTMVRPSEAAGTRWEELDLDAKIWRIPAERMKKKKPHSVPLSDAAIQIICDLKEKTGHRDHVFFSARTKTGYLNESTANVALKRMGYHGILVAHGLRSIASTTLNEAGHSADLIEAALAHVDKNQIRAAYNRSEYIELRRPMMEWWSNFIQK